MNKNNKNKIILFSLIAILIVVVAVDAVSFRYISDESYKIYNLRRIFYEEYSENHSASNIGIKLSEVSTKNDLINKLFLSEEKIVDFIGEVEAFGSSTKAVIKTENVDASGLIDEETNKKKTYGHVTITFSAVGSWEELNNFVGLLENLPYISAVNSIKLSKSENSGKISWNETVLLDVIVKTK